MVPNTAHKQRFAKGPTYQLIRSSSATEIYDGAIWLRIFQVDIAVVPAEAPYVISWPFEWIWRKLRHSFEGEYNKSCMGLIVTVRF
jgi:hypothetical protein